MIRSSRKFIAVLMLLWLPVFTGSALAASVSMLLPQSCCSGTAMSHEGMSMETGEHQMHHSDMPAPAGEHDSCGVCQLACTGYLSVPSVELSAIQVPMLEFTPLLITFNSVTFTPLLPPPLARV